MSRWSKLFSQGWGDESLLTTLSTRISYADPPSSISVTWSSARKRRGMVRRDGAFASPLALLPKEASTAHVRAWTREGNSAAVVILAASRDEGYQVRERVFGPLTARGLDIYFMENPFYGLRRTRGGPSLITVSDHGLMVLGMVWEARALLEHLRTDYLKVAVAGYSMGGHMAAITPAGSCHGVWTTRRWALPWVAERPSARQPKHASSDCFPWPTSPASRPPCVPTPPSSLAANAMATCCAARPSASISTGREASCVGSRPATSRRWSAAVVPCVTVWLMPSRICEGWLPAITGEV